MENKKEPLISIIVPVYNTEDYLRKCIDSILKQKYEKFELILVDDGSTDGSGLICEEYARNDCRIHVFHQRNGGQGSARNLGLKECRGDYICFIDSDDTVSETYLSTMIYDCIEKNNLVAVCNVEKQDARFYSDYSVFLENVLTDNIGGQLWKFLFHRSLWENISIPENRYAEDAMVLPKVLIRTNTVSVIFQELYHYNAKNPVSSSNSNSKLLKNTVDRALMFIERYSWVQIHGYPHIRDTILRKSTEFSIGAMGCYKKYEYDQKDIQILCSFLKTNKQNILRLKALSTGRKIAVILINFNPKFYCFVRNICKG